jgi:sulfoxide reductase heme-binding subunit YedZ
MKPLTFIVLALPLGWLGYAIAGEVNAPGSVLGADPGEAVVHFLGEWGIRFLLLSLAISSARRLFGWNRLIRLRRMTGLFAFAYLAMHFLAYLGFLITFDLALLIEDFSERPYITVGMLALAMLSLLALTSTSGWQRRLKRNWQKLHRLVYPAAGLGLLHLIWLTREGYEEVAAYTLILLLLMGERIYASVHRRKHRSNQRELRQQQSEAPVTL